MWARLTKKIAKFHPLHLLYWGAIGALVLLAIFSLSTLIPLPGNTQILIVQSGSMQPAIKTGSIILIRPESTYRVGDIVTIDDPEVDIRLTHRIVEIVEKEGSTEFVTRGDANDSVDSAPFPSSSVLGKVQFSVPYLGYPLGFVRTQLGLILLIIIPATLIIYTELQSIIKEGKRLLKRQKSQGEKPGAGVSNPVTDVERSI